jgi:hypothetical protein
MLRDNAGNRLFRVVDIKIYFPDKIFPTRHLVNHAPPHKGYSGDNIDDMLMQVADRLNVLYPWWSFRMVELKPEGRRAYYAFNFAGYNAKAFPAGLVDPAAEAGLMPNKEFVEKTDA